LPRSRSGAIRYRFYSRWGLSGSEVVKVIAFCALTVALGLMILGGASLVLAPGLASEYTRLPRAVVLLAGWVCLGLSAAYLVACVFDWRPVPIGRYRLYVPPFHLALGQAIIGPLNFAMVAACLYQGIAAVRDVSYLAVAASYVIANVTGMHQPCARRPRGDRKCYIVSYGRRPGDRRGAGVPRRVLLPAAGARRHCLLLIEGGLLLRSRRGAEKSQQAAGPASRRRRR
jgi:hypothetical protein